MFNNKENLKDWFREHLAISFNKHRIESHQHQFDHRFLICETCGCLVDPARAIKGESFVKSEIKYFINRDPIDQEIVYTPYYCLVHVPNQIPKEPKLKTIEELYKELIMEVSKKFPDESRHETARRYIRERENSSNNSCAKESKK